MTPVLDQPKQYKACLLGVLLSICFCFTGTGYTADPSTNSAWVVQLGSFKEQENAQNFISKIKKKGYTPFIEVNEDSSWYKIRVGPYPSKDEADQVVLDLKKAQDITAIVLVSEGGPPDLEEPIDSVDIVVSQFLIWLNAWKAQQITSYLSFYSKDFEDPKRSRENWEAQRRKLLSKRIGRK